MLRTWPGRSRLNGRKRNGVSPIIGIILLVAITVVLAAVLYVLISGYAHDGGVSTPIGTALALGPAAGVTGTKTTSTYCATNHPCYAVSIASAGTGITLGDVKFVVTQNGVTRVVQSNSAQISIVGSSGTAVAYTTLKKGDALETTSWAKFATGFSAASPLVDTMSIWIQFGSTTLHPEQQGFSLEVVGAGTFSGTMNFALP